MTMKKPVPEDFGLTAEEYEEAINEGFPLKEDFPVENISEEAKYIFWFSGIGGAVAGGLIDRIDGLQMGILGGTVLGLFVGLIIYSSIEDTLRAKKTRERDECYRQAEEPTRPLREKVKNYEKSQRDYQLSLEIAEVERQRRREEYWESLRGVEFEESLGQLYSNLGYAVEITKASGDGGVDLFLQKDEKVIVVQCKGHKKPIGVGTARDLYGAMMHFEANSAILACPAGFTAGVVKFATDKAIQLVSATELVAMAESASNHGKRGQVQPAYGRT